MRCRGELIDVKHVVEHIGEDGSKRASLELRKRVRVAIEDVRIPRARVEIDTD